MKHKEIHDEPALIWTGKEMLAGRMLMPSGGPATAMVIASLGGTMSHSGYQELARRFAEEGFAVLLADLLTGDEQQMDSRTGHYRTNVPLIADRVHSVVNWLDRQYHDGFHVGFFGSGAVGAAAIVVAGQHAEIFSLLMLAAPRTDLAAAFMPALRTPTLFLVPESDPALLRMTKEFMSSAPGQMRMTVLMNASSMVEDEKTTGLIGERALDFAREHAAVLAAAPAMA